MFEFILTTNFIFNIN